MTLISLIMPDVTIWRWKDGWGCGVYGGLHMMHCRRYISVCVCVSRVTTIILAINIRPMGRFSHVTRTARDRSSLCRQQNVISCNIFCIIFSSLRRYLLSVVLRLRALWIVCKIQGAYRTVCKLDNQSAVNQSPSAASAARPASDRKQFFLSFNQHLINSPPTEISPTNNGTVIDRVEFMTSHCHGRHFLCGTFWTILLLRLPDVRHFPLSRQTR